MGFFEFLSIMRARWRDVAMVFAGCVIASQLISLSSTRLYSATASVVVSSMSDPVAGTNAAHVMSDEMQTQTDIVTSQSVAERVAQILRLDQDPAMQRAWRRSTGGRGDYLGWLARELLKHLSVSPPHGSNVISISVLWTSARGAATIANAFAQAYIDTSIQLRVQPARQYASWFNERSRALRGDLEAKQKLLSDYEEKSGILATDEHLDVEMARLTQLSSELVTVQAQRAESQSRELQAARDRANSPEILQSPLIASLKTELSAAEAKEQNLGTLLDTNHPEYRRVAAEVSALTNRISLETDKIISSLRNTREANAHRERTLVAAIDAQRTRVTELRHRRDHAALLQSDVAIAQRNLDSVSQGLAQTSLESQARQANLAQLTRASEPTGPSSPQYLLNLALGMLFGGALGVAAALWREKIDQRVRSDADLRKLFAVPLLATLGIRPSKSREVPQLGFWLTPPSPPGNETP
jgi:chain length determinant protein EpsF